MGACPFIREQGVEQRRVSRVHPGSRSASGDAATIAARFSHNFASSLRAEIDGKWYADFRFQHADGRAERIRKACILRNHLIPAFDTMSLNEIKTHPIEVLKAALVAEGKSASE